MTFDINLVSAISILAPTITGAIFYNRLPSFARILYGFVVVTFLLEILSRVYYEYGWNNMFLFHLYTFMEVGFICGIYYTLSDSPRWKKAILSTSTLFILLSLINLLFFDDITHFNSVQRYFEMVLIYSILGASILQSIHDANRRPFLRDPVILLTLGYMLYFLGTLFLFVYGQQILSGKINYYWIIHGVFNIFLNGIYVLVFIRSRIN